MQSIPFAPRVVLRTACESVPVRVEVSVRLIDTPLGARHAGNAAGGDGAGCVPSVVAWSTPPFHADAITY